MPNDLRPPVYRRLWTYYTDRKCLIPFADQQQARSLWWRREFAVLWDSIRATVSAGFKLGMVGILLIGVWAAWEEALKRGDRSHDEIISVNQNAWTNGEYKDCSSLNTKTIQQTYLDCSAISGEPREFKVRFYGLTYDSQLPQTFIHNWKCLKNGGFDPTFTCRLSGKE